MHFELVASRRYYSLHFFIALANFASIFFDKAKFASENARKNFIVKDDKDDNLDETETDKDNDVDENEIEDLDDVIEG